MRWTLIAIALLVTSANAFAQVDSSIVATKIRSVDNPRPYLRAFQSFGEKANGNQNLHDCAEWLMSEYIGFGYESVRFDSFNSPLAGVNFNVIAELKGETDSLIIIGSHYDTKNGPGVNDNGTGVVTTMLIAKMLRAENPHYSFRFIHFAGEEQGFYGSAHEAQQTELRGDSVLYYFNLDQLGGTKGAPDNYKLLCERDENNNPSGNNAKSATITADIAQIIAKYTSIQTSISNAFSSDYEPYQSRNFVITGLYQSSSYPYTHSLADTLGNVDTDATWEIIRGALAVALIQGKVPSINVGVETIADNKLKIYPNPVSDNLFFSWRNHGSETEYSIYNSQAQLLQSGHAQDTIDVSNLNSGLYFIRLQNGELSVIKRFVKR